MRLLAIENIHDDVVDIIVVFILVSVQHTVLWNYKHSDITSFMSAIDIHPTITINIIYCLKQTFVV